MTSQTYSTILLLIINGLGISEYGKINRADTPNLSKYSENFPTASLYAGGPAVGLKEGVKLDSELGHIVLGSGRKYDSIASKISRYFNRQDFAKQSKLAEIEQKVSSKEDSKLNLIGVLDPAEKLTKLNHLLGLVNYYREKQIPANLHLILETKNSTNLELNQQLMKLEDELESDEFVDIATIADRKYALGNFNWNRIASYYQTLLGEKENFAEFDQASNVLSDKSEQIDILVNSQLQKKKFIQDGEPILFFNYKKDYILDLVKAFSLPVFKKFERKFLAKSDIYSLVEYDRNLPVESIFSQTILQNTLPEILNKEDVNQAYITPVEKFSHLNYYFNGSRREKHKTEDRITLNNNRKLSSDDYKMVGEQIYKKITQLLQQDNHTFIVAEFPNFELINDESRKITALEYIDKKVGKIVDNTLVKQGGCLITSDYSQLNSDKNQVPLYLVSNEYKGLSFPNGDVPHGELSLATPAGSLTNIAPTILDLLNVESPDEIKSKTLLPV
jgi:2,3-bisphosphoglycerate-independent phosphoglycerate mutase